MAKSKKQGKSKASVRKTTKTKPPKIKLPSWFTNAKLHSWVIFFFGVLLYANTLGHEFAQDDAIVLYDNAFVQEGLAGIPEIFQYDTFYGFFQEAGKAKLVAGGRYRPFTLAMFALEVQLFGINPFIGHLVNALLNGLLGLLIYHLFLRLLDPKKRPALAFFIALGTALIFVAHPIHTEAVANIKGRDEIMALLGSLGALYFSLLAVQRSKISLHLLSGLIFLVGLLSKENAITFLAVAPLVFYFFTKSNLRTVIGATLPFLLASILFLIIRSSVLGFDFGDQSQEMMNNPFIKVENNAYLPFTQSEKTATITYGLGKYLQLLVFPHPLTHDYYPRQIGVMNWGDWRVIISLLAYLALLVYAIRRLVKKDLIAFGLLYFFITLSIVSNILFPIGTHLAERLLFMPSLAYCFLLPVLIHRFMIGNKRLAFEKWKPALIVLGLVTLAYAGKTLSRNPIWKNNYRLFTTDIQTSSNSAKLRNAVGGELVTQAAKVENEAQRAPMLQEAEEPSPGSDSHPP